MSTAIDKVDAFNPKDGPNPFHKLDTPSTLLVTSVSMIDDNEESPVDDKEAANIQAAVHTITPLPMPDRVIKVIKDWERCHQKEDKAKPLKFLNPKWQQYDWENIDLEEAKGLVKSKITHPNISAKFPGIGLELELPHHHHVVKIINNSKDKLIYAVQRKASLNDLPHKTAGVSTAIDEVDAFDPEEDPNPVHELDTPPPHRKPNDFGCKI